MDNAEAPSTWEREGLRAYGFQGFVPFAALPASDVPRKPGVYCVIRPSAELPEFRAISPAGHFKGRDPTVTVGELEALWVPDAVVVYIGRANHGADEKRGLYKRLDEFRNFGGGKPVGHSGGKRIWQLKDSGQLLVAWKVTEDIEVKRTERHLIDTFQQHYGRLPFANMY